MHRMGTALGCALSLVSCGSLPTPEGDQPVSADAPVAPPPAAAPDPPACVTSEAEAAADTALFVDGACDGNYSYGETNGLNVSVGAAALRFVLDLDATKALARGKVARITIVLSTNPGCADCGAGGLPTRAGTLAVHVMRSDWDEGTAVGRTGADGCRRKTGIGWGKNGDPPSAGTHLAPRTDYDEIAAGVRSYADGATDIEIDLSAQAITDFRDLKGEGTSSVVSLYVKSTAQVILAARESGRPARLRVTRCE